MSKTDGQTKLKCLLKHYPIYKDIKKYCDRKDLDMDLFIQDLIVRKDQFYKNNKVKGFFYDEYSAYLRSKGQVINKRIQKYFKEFLENESNR